MARGVEEGGNGRELDSKLGRRSVGVALSIITFAWRRNVEVMMNEYYRTESERYRPS